MTPSTLLRPHAHGNRIFSLYRYQIHLKPSSGSLTRDHDAPRPLTREHARSTAHVHTEHERAARAHECEPACHATPPGAKLRFASRTTRYSHQTCTQTQVGARTEGCEAGMRGSSGASPAAWVGRVGVSELRVGETPSASRRSSGRWRLDGDGVAEAFSAASRRNRRRLPVCQPAHTVGTQGAQGGEGHAAMCARSGTRSRGRGDSGGRGGLGIPVWSMPDEEILEDRPTWM